VFYKGVRTLGGELFRTAQVESCVCMAVDGNTSSINPGSKLE